MVSLKEEALKKAGFSEREIKVYLANLTTGAATANTISVYAKIGRTTTYDILKSLKEKGVASYVLKDKKKCFEVISPRNLLSLMDENKKVLNAALPELEALRMTTLEKPKVTLFEGKIGIKSIIYDVYQEGKNFEVYANSDIIRFLDYDFDKLVKIRTEKNIFVRVIHENSEATKRLMKEKKRHREIRYLDNFLLPTATFIYSDKVAIFNFSNIEPIGILIKSKEISDSQRKVFEKLWILSKK
jgi:sugar-specific transcriptional regulator TrmB